jgi:hypothetical protein
MATTEKKKRAEKLFQWKQDGVKALSEHETKEQATRALTAKLRAERIARETQQPPQKAREGKMAFGAVTLHREIGVGAALCITEEPQIEGGPYKSLRAGNAFSIETSTNDRTSATVISASATEMVIQLADGTKWEMTRHAPTDPPMKIKTPGLHSECWVIRSPA